MIKAVIFDYGGVFVKYKPGDIYVTAGQKLGVGDRVSAFVKKYYSIMGKMTRGEILKHISKTGINPKVWERNVVQLLEKRKRRKELVALAKRLKKKGYVVSLLSNVNSITARFNKTRGYYDIFSPFILSCEVKAMKPQKKIYRIALRRIGLSPKACVFIDDHDRCIKTAKKLGMHAIPYKTSSQVMKDLKKLGVKW